MIYYSIDIECGGFDPTQDSILEFAMVREDTLSKATPVEELPFFHCFFLPPKATGKYSGSAFALSMHERIFKILSQNSPDSLILTPMELTHSLSDPYFPCRGFFPAEKTRGKYGINVAGKNFQGFDAKFLSAQTNFFDLFEVHRRVIDPAILFFENGMPELPSLETCKKIASRKDPTLFASTDVEHSALEDARDVIRLLRTKI